MIRGSVNHRREAIVSVVLSGPDGRQVHVDAVVDTGFNGVMSVPTAMAIALGLPRRAGGTAYLADGSKTTFGYYLEKIQVLSKWRDVLLSDVADEPMIGMRFLDGCQLRLEARVGGLVEIRPLG